MTFDDAIRELKDRLHWPEISPLDLRLPIDRLRQQFSHKVYTAEPDSPELAEIRPMSIPGAAGPLPARLYVPLGAGLPPGPGILFFHGGGFVLGDLDTHDMICRRLASGARARVLSVGYRLAPEHKFPAAHEDALAAWRYLQDASSEAGIDPARTALCGDSAGGNLAAFIAQEMARQGGPVPAFQLLLYPLLQFADIRSKRMPLQESGLFISANLFEFFRGHYLTDTDDRMDPRVSPLFAPLEDLKGLPPAHIIVCGWDPLHDEGVAYAQKLEAAGVPVTVRTYDSMMHGFLNLTNLSAAAREAANEAGRIVGAALGAR
jgi:acetyl esterase